jgi:F0F1-type ATP synthase assembly protein I
MMAIVLGGVWVGIKLDDKIQPSFPIFKLVFSLLSVAIAMYVVIKQVLNESKKD